MNGYYAVVRFTGRKQLSHHGVKGQKHGVRRFQNEDGTLTAEGRQHYGIGDERRPSNSKELLSNRQLKRYDNLRTKAHQLQDKAADHWLARDRSTDPKTSRDANHPLYNRAEARIIRKSEKLSAKADSLDISRVRKTVDRQVEKEIANLNKMPSGAKKSELQKKIYEEAKRASEDDPNTKETVAMRRQAYDSYLKTPEGQKINGHSLEKDEIKGSKFANECRNAFKKYVDKNGEVHSINDKTKNEIKEKIKADPRYKQANTESWDSYRNYLKAQKSLNPFNKQNRVRESREKHDSSSDRLNKVSASVLSDILKQYPKKDQEKIMAWWYHNTYMNM